jgi:hypothetical protein
MKSISYRGFIDLPTFAPAFRLALGL